ncbi:hypothetical protein FoTM2_013578 [Fusarium oxysporum f. sp. vasinfectum]|nr:hypothetical protein FoTM2_013578 [Fusarium oxysporum f. sp. vasinfectum]
MFFSRNMTILVQSLNHVTEMSFSIFESLRWIEDGNLEPKTATLADNSIPAPLEHHCNRMDLFGMWTQNIRNQMVMPEANPISICLQLLGPAVVLLRELQQAVGVEPSSPLGRFTAGTVDGCKTSTVIMEKTIDASFTVEIDLIGKLSLESIGKRFGDSEAPFIHDMIFGDAVLLKLMVDMRKYCHDSEHVSSLPIALQYAAATVYLGFFECCVKVLVQRETQTTRHGRWEGRSWRDCYPEHCSHVLNQPLHVPHPIIIG